MNRFLSHLKSRLKTYWFKPGKTMKGMNLAKSQRRTHTHKTKFFDKRYAQPVSLKDATVTKTITFFPQLSQHACKWYLNYQIEISCGERKFDSHSLAFIMGPQATEWLGTCTQASKTQSAQEIAKGGFLDWEKQICLGRQNLTWKWWSALLEVVW